MGLNDFLYGPVFPFVIVIYLDKENNRAERGILKAILQRQELPHRRYWQQVHRKQLSLSSLCLNVGITASKEVQK